MECILASRHTDSRVPFNPPRIELTTVSIPAVSPMQSYRCVGPPDILRTRTQRDGKPPDCCKGLHAGIVLGLTYWASLDGLNKRNRE